MDYRKHLEGKFRKYQAILSDRAEERQEEKIDLEEIVQDFCIVDDNSDIVLRYIPIKGDKVFFTINMYSDNAEDKLVSLTNVGNETLSCLVEIMRKAMIIEELRNTYIHESSRK